MPRATNSDGSLAPLTSTNSTKNCVLYTPCGNICFYILPEIGDSKRANYAKEIAIGRSNPIVTFAQSDPRMINTELKFMTTTTDSINSNWMALKIIQSLVYPSGASGGNNPVPYTPPPVVKFVCGDLMDGPGGLCLILLDYNVRYPTNVAWDKDTFLPYQFSINCTWEVVYACKNLPTNNCVAGCVSQSCQPLTPGPLVPFTFSEQKAQSMAPAVAFVPRGAF